MFEVHFNTEFKRWEVFSENAPIRAGEKQPAYVSPFYADAVAYVCRCGGAIG